MQLEYELVPQDYASFVTHHYHTGARGAANHRFSRFVAPVLWVLMTIPDAIRHGVGVFQWTFWALAVLWVAGIPAWFRSASARRVRRMASEGISRGAVGFRQLILDDEGISESTPFYRHQTYWAGIDQVVETPTHVFIYTGPNAAMIVPKHAVDEDATALREAIGAYRRQAAA